MIKFNRLGKQAKFDANNFFYAQLSPTRATMFKQAFGLAHSKTPLLRYERDKDGSPIKSIAPHAYQEDLLSQRQYVQNMLETFAGLLGAELSQVVHAVVSGNREAFVKVLLRHIAKHTVERQIMVWDTELGENKPKTTYELELPYGHRWTGNPKAIDADEVRKKITAAWDASGGIMTAYEKAVEGGDEALAKFKTEEAAKRRKNWNTSRKDSMKGVQVVNARQKARREAIAAG